MRGGTKLRRRSRPKLRRGDVVEVRPAAEILATLDDRGALDGLPFMPEMLDSIGHRFVVTARVERACDTINKGGRVRRMPDAVVLGDVRCDGSGHGGCGAGCRVYWKEAWLRRVDSADPAALDADGDARAALERLTVTNAVSFDPEGEPIYRCQATEFVRATEELAYWDVGSFLRELTSGNVGPGRFVAVCVRIVVEEIRQRLGVWKYPVQPTDGAGAPAANLGLQPGARVRVRPRSEIFATLDERGKNRGLWFDREMLPYCGHVRTVERRVTRIVDEATGRMIVLHSDCLVLGGVVCQSHLSRGRWFCPRAITPYWREAWLGQVTEDPQPGAGD